MTAGSTHNFFHCCSAGVDPESLLDPANQFTEPWGGDDHGPCDKCGEQGSVTYECRSCLERGSEPQCPSCQGRVRFRGPCPTCDGSGRIDRTRRRGIAAFPTREGLYRYLAEKGAETENRVIVELEGRPSDDHDLDADAGALLVLPERINAADPLDGSRIAEIRARLG